MATKEEHTAKLICSVDFWEWENPMHHGSDFTSYYESHEGKFRHLRGMEFECGKCGKEAAVA